MNPIAPWFLSFRAKTMPQIKEKRHWYVKMAPTGGNRVRGGGQNLAEILSHTFLNFSWIQSLSEPFLVLKTST